MSYAAIVSARPKRVKETSERIIVITSLIFLYLRALEPSLNAFLTESFDFISLKSPDLSDFILLSSVALKSLEVTRFFESPSLITAPEERALIKHLASLPVEIIESAKSYDPARITRYAIDLATLFHKFYNACRVKGEEEKLMQSRLTLCTATKIAIHNVLTLLKVSTPEVM